jgi:hypothetical protein
MRSETSAHVVVHPRELRLDKALGGEALAELDDGEVGNVELHVLRQVKVLLRDEHALCEAIFSSSSPPARPSTVPLNSCS